MKQKTDKKLRRLLCCGLVLAMVLFNTSAVFAAEEDPAAGAGMQEVSQSEPDACTEAEETAAPDPAPAVEKDNAGAADESKEPSPVQEPAPAEEIRTEETKGSSDDNPAPEPSAGKTEAADVESEKNAVPEPPADKAADNEKSVTETDVNTPEPETQKKPAEDPVENTRKVITSSAPATDKGSKRAAKNTAADSSSENDPGANTITIGDTSFDPEADESSHWSNDTGWKNIAGEYIAMVDYDGSKEELSADGGVVKLAVAGVNRIASLKGNCSYEISGSGIVLIDSIDIAEGQYISLHTNTAVYDEGSAAVFLKEGKNYVLVNGDTTGILDEVYELDDISLVIPQGASLLLRAMAVCTETWSQNGTENTAVTKYTDTLPRNYNQPVHEGGKVDLKSSSAKLTLGKNGTLTVNDGASVQLKEVDTSSFIGLESIAANLIVQGILDIEGIVEGGFLSIDGGSLTGEGTVSSANVILEPGSDLSGKLLLDNSSLTINGSDRSVSAKIKDSNIYLKGSRIYLPELDVSGKSRIGVETEDTNYGASSIGNITLSPGSSLDILANDHEYYEKEFFDSSPTRYIEDCFLNIHRTVTGGAVNVLAGLVNCTEHSTGVTPLVPNGYFARVLVHGTSTRSTEFPLNMTVSEASDRASSPQIPVLKYYVFDTMVPEEIGARSWVAYSSDPLKPLDRNNDLEFTCASFLKMYGLSSSDGSQGKYYTGVEVIDSSLERHIYWIDDKSTFSTHDVIMIRVFDCKGSGGQGGSASTHVMTSVTGSGVIGSPGSGHVKAGTGAVIFGARPDQVPDDPAPDDEDNNSNNNNNNSNNSGNGKPANSVDNNADTGTKNSVSNVSDSSKSADTTNDSGSSKSDDAAIDSGSNRSDDATDNSNNNRDKRSDNSEKIKEKSSQTDKKSNSRSEKNDHAKKAVYTANAGEFAVEVSLLDPMTEDTIKTDADKLQIWQLNITNDGVPVTDLSDDPVKVVFPFTFPEAWGDPAELAEDSLYAVFADENGELTAFRAQYDPDTGEVSFETKQTGEFVIVRFEYEEEAFTDGFYSALAELDDIQTFLAVLGSEHE